MADKLDSSPLPPITEKRSYVRQMFTEIAPRYDLMNRLMTLGRDQVWRRTVVRLCALPAGGRLLDVATGTGDIAYEALRLDPTVHAAGLDLTREMMLAGRGKQPGLDFPFAEGDALALPFPSSTFDAACSGFMMRNVVDIRAAFAEQARVVKPGGRVVCLEITLPRTPVFGRTVPPLLLQAGAAAGRVDQRPARGLHLSAALRPGVPAAVGVGTHHDGGWAAGCSLSIGHAGHGGRALGDEMKRLIIGMSGASGQIYGIRLLEALRNAAEVETHLVISPSARMTIAQETAYTPRDVEALADVVYRPADIGAAIASGSFETSGMIVAPCSIKSLSAIARSFDDDLLIRAADVQLKEGRPVLLMVRETPLHLGHLELMTQAARIGCIIFPPVPAFYSRPATIDDIVNGTVGRVLARMGFENALYHRWLGMREAAKADDQN